MSSQPLKSASNNPYQPSSIEMFGCRIDALTMSETIDRIEHIIRKGTPSQHVVINAAKAVMVNRDESLRKIVQNCAIVNADGQSVVWAARLLRKPLPERVAGIDIMTRLIEVSERTGYRVYFLGARDEVISRFVQVIEERFPKLKVVGSRNGYFDDSEKDVVVQQVRRAKPDILFVGISSPKKEFWLAENLDALGVPFVMGVGGSFDVVAGETSRAPEWMQRTGLEWLHRLGMEPRRMWRRYFIGNTVFLYMVAKEFFLERSRS